MEFLLLYRMEMDEVIQISEWNFKDVNYAAVSAVIPLPSWVSLTLVLVKTDIRLFFTSGGLPFVRKSGEEAGILTKQTSVITWDLVD